jgi:UDP-N-acetylmuramoyl-L-alanyl-D-glutamate--2,6-diaminopimelate ligase
MRLIDQTVKKGICIINKDDPSCEVITKHAIARSLQVFQYSLENTTEENIINATDIQETQVGVEFKINNVEFKLKLPGKYNISNALAAITTTTKMGVDLATCKNALENMSQLEGRWMVLQEKPYKVVVDFAHTPNALQNLLQYSQKQLTNRGRLIVVFGTAGLRDFTKRPLMGEVTAKYADIVILTAEDPRTEKVEDINSQIIEGINKIPNKVFNKDYFSIIDRKEAIQFALDSAQANDLVVITGKGHEKSMNLDGKSEIHWDDVEVTKDLLKAASESHGLL